MDHAGNPPAAERATGTARDGVGRDVNARDVDAQDVAEERRIADGVAAERLTFFSDAVVAIAITLLALELPVPAALTNAEAWHEVSADRAEYLSFLISFVVIGAHWASHHRLFRHVDRVGGRLSLLNLLWLLMQILTPFAAKVLSGDGAFQFRFGLYATVQALAGLLFLLLVREIRAHGLYRRGTPPELFPNAYVGAGILALGFALSVPVSFVTEQYAYDLWFAVPVLTAVVRRLIRRNRRP
ncbi:TMEM175 family protein [Actinoplanes sp. NPDC051494]|uniref:TMEM175 family protein n=1 Tax=Actinoplanes sp. NPDC051494 TaxID=3363907 RepID=UPI0037B0991D